LDPIISPFGRETKPPPVSRIQSIVCTTARVNRYFPDLVVVATRSVQRLFNPFGL